VNVVPDVRDFAEPILFVVEAVFGREVLDRAVLQKRLEVTVKMGDGAEARLACLTGVHHRHARLG
jgi:hypothetical protein